MRDLGGGAFLRRRAGLIPAQLLGFAFGFGCSVKAILMTSETSLTATNRIQGLVLDLRYTDGSDYASAAETASIEPVARSLRNTP